MGEKKIKLLEDSLKCTQCQVSHNEWMTEAILNLLIRERYGVEIDPDKFRKIIWDEDFIYEDIENKLKKYAAKEREEDLKKS